MRAYLTNKYQYINFEGVEILIISIYQLLTNIEVFPLFTFKVLKYFIRRLRLASDSYSILLSWLISLANIQFLWIIDAAERPEPGAHALGAPELQTKREVKCRNAN